MAQISINASDKPVAGCLTLFGLPFAGFGMFGAIQGIREISMGKWKSGLGLVLVSFAFCAVGFGLMIFGVFSANTIKRVQVIQKSHPDEPWLWREDWACGEVKAGNKAGIVFVWAFALFWNAISTSGFIAALPQMKTKPVLLAVLLFPLVGLCLLIWAIRQTLRWRRFGDSTLKLTTMPGVIGGAFGGVVHSTRPVYGAKEVRLRLVCMERDTGGDSTSEHVQWEDEKILSGEVLQIGNGIPVLFNIPFDCQPTATLLPNRSIVWRLHVSAKLAGPDYEVQFEVPVFKTAQSTEHPQPLPDPAAAYEKSVEASPPPGITIQPAATGGTEFYFAAGRNKGTASGMTLFTIVWIGIFVGMIKFKAPIGLPIAWGIFSLLLLLLLVTQWTAWSRVVADASGLQVTKSWLLIRSQQRIATTELQKVEANFSMSAGTTSYYDMRAVTNAGKKVKLASMIKGKKESEWLAHEIQNALARR